MTVADAGGTSRTISNDITDFSLNTPRGVQDVTGVDKSAHERLLLLADCSVSLKGVANFASNMSHDVFKTVTSSDEARAVSVAPTANNDTPLLTFTALFSDYGLSRSASGELTWSTKGDNSDGALPVWA